PQGLYPGPFQDHLLRPGRHPAQRYDRRAGRRPDSTRQVGQGRRHHPVRETEGPRRIRPRPASRLEKRCRRGRAGQEPIHPVTEALMAESVEYAHRPLLEAVAFAARAHHHHLRKDGRTPYASHVFRVCLVVRHVFGIDDPKTLTAAVLHDTVEDTTTDHDDIAEQFGREVADWVGLLSKDKRLPEDAREQAYCDQLARAPWQVKVCK